MELRFLPTTPSPSAPPLATSGDGSDGGGGGTFLTNNNIINNSNTHGGPCPYPSTNHTHHQQQQHLQNPMTHPNQTIIGAGPPPAGVGVGPEHLMLASMPHRRTLERSVRNLHHGAHNGHVVDQQQKMMLEGGDCGVTTTVGAGVGIVLGPAARNNSSSMRRGRRGSGSVPGSPRVGRGPSAELLQHNRSPMPIRAAASGVKRAARLGRAENMSSGSLNSIEV